MTPASSKSMLTAESESLPRTPSVPNVVIGVTPSPSSVSEIPPSTSHAEAAVQLELPVTPSTPPVAVAPVRDTLIAPSLPVEDDEPASEERIRVAEKVEEESQVEEKPEPSVNLHDTLIDAQKIEIVKPAAEHRHEETLVDAPKPIVAEPVAAKSEAPKPNFEKTLPMGSAEDFAPKSEAKAEPKVEAKVEAEKPVVQDEETIPPAGDLAVSEVAEVAEQFFSEGDVARLAGAPDDDLDSLTSDEKAQRKSDPEVVRRRAKLAKYVTWAVGVSAALCLVAVVRTTFTSSSKTITAANAASVKTEIAVKAPPAPTVAPSPKAAEPAAAAIAAEPTEPVKAVVTGDVKEEKAKVKAALDKNKLADAIDAGERAVAIDETDSEAWLLLGAAYQAKGDLKEARRAYRSCLDKGTKDKFQRECRLFAR
jgi:tetratricopeptide (TPR) repeat protein